MLLKRGASERGCAKTFLCVIEKEAGQELMFQEG